MKKSMKKSETTVKMTQTGKKKKIQKSDKVVPKCDRLVIKVFS